MSRLYFNIGLAVLVASLLGGGIMFAALNQVLEQTQREAREDLVDGNLRQVLNALERTEPNQWPPIVDQARADGIHLIGILPRKAGDPGTSELIEESEPHRGRLTGPLLGQPPPPGGPPPPGPAPVMLQRLPRGPKFQLPIKGGRFVVVVRAPKADLPLLIPAFMFVVLLVVLSALMVGWPLNRRFRALQAALGQLEEGNLAVRLDDASGALGGVAKRLNRSAEALESMFQEREDLLQAVSHELGTPLSRMRLQIAMLREDSDESKRLARLGALEDDLEEMQQLTKELVSWLEAGSGGHTEEVFDAGEMVEALLELATEFADPELDVTFTCDEPVELRANPRLFQRTIENLLTNAVRYTDRTIVVSVTRDDTWVRIRVDDDGPGIPVEDRRRVLEPFVRLESSRSKEFGGIGLGMAIAARIVRGHGGEISIDESGLGGARIETLWKRG